MNKFKIIFTYTDNKTASLYLNQSLIEDFFKKINAGMVFIDEESGVGFWTSLTHVRHIIVKPEVYGEEGSNS